MWKQQLWNKFLEGLSHKGEGSEKRIVIAVAIPVLLGLTSYSTFHEGYIRIEILAAWFSYLGYTGYRITSEKKMDNQQNNV